MHAACSRSPHNVLHSPRLSTQDTDGTRSTVYTLQILSHRYLVGGVNEMLSILACATNYLRCRDTSGRTKSAQYSEHAAGFEGK